MTHMPRNDAAATGHVYPGIRIHTTGIVQPPGIGIPRTADMDAHQRVVSAALATKSSAEIPKKTRMAVASPLAVFVVTAPPHARLIASLWCAVEPLIHAPEAVQSARKRGIGVVDDAILKHERAHARPLSRVRRCVRSGHGGVLGNGRVRHAARHSLVSACL